MSEAIISTDEEVEDKVLDYMLYYVFVRSESADHMAYKTLIAMLDEHLQARERAQSAQRKNRPESSSPEKIKARNQGKQQAKPSEPSSSDSEGKQLKNDLDLDDYSDDLELQEAVAEPDAAEDKPASGAAAAPQADKENDDDYSEDEEQYLAEFDRVKQQQAAQGNDDGGKDGDDQFEESPRPKLGSQGLASSGPLAGEDEDEEEDR